MRDRVTKMRYGGGRQGGISRFEGFWGGSGLACEDSGSGASHDIEVCKWLLLFMRTP